MSEENLAARSRRLTEEALEPLEKKVRAGEWYPADAVRTMLVRVINRYESLLEIALATPAPEEEEWYPEN